MFLRIATTFPVESSNATSFALPTAFFCWSSMANTIGTDMLATEPSCSLRELKWSVWRNSACLMKPLRGLAHPSLKICAHSRSILESFIRGNEEASLFSEALWASGTISSTSCPPSGSIRELLITPIFLMQADIGDSAKAALYLKRTEFVYKGFWVGNWRTWCGDWALGVLNIAAVAEAIAEKIKLLGRCPKLECSSSQDMILKWALEFPRISATIATKLEKFNWILKWVINFLLYSNLQLWNIRNSPNLTRNHRLVFAFSSSFASSCRIQDTF